MTYIVAGFPEICTDGIFQDDTGAAVISSILPIGKTHNDKITISGANFSSTKGTVIIGGYTCTIVSWSDTEIVVIISQNVTPGTNTVSLITSTACTSSSYNVASPTGQLKSIRQKLREAIEYGVKQITVANGYNYTVKGAYDPPIGLEQMQEFPSINISYEQETAANADLGSHLQTGGNEALLHNSFIVQFDCLLSDIENMSDSQDKMLADIQKYFGNYYWIPDSNGNATAFNCIYMSSTPWGVHERKPLTGITVEYLVWYRQYLTNPAVSG